MFAGRALPCGCLAQESESVRKLVALLDTLWRWVDETPPAAHTMRYGNPAYRTWLHRMEGAAPQARAGPMLRSRKGGSVKGLALLRPPLLWTGNWCWTAMLLPAG